MFVIAIKSIEELGRRKCDSIFLMEEQRFVRIDDILLHFWSLLTNETN